MPRGYRKDGSKLGFQTSNKNINWKGDKAGINAVHMWVRPRFKKPELCQSCKKSPPVDMANIGHTYRRVLSDWEWLCRKCHMVKDGRLEEFRTREKKFQKSKKSCPHGHGYTTENTYFYKGERSCKTCNRTKALKHYHAKKLAMTKEGEL